MPFTIYVILHEDVSEKEAMRISAVIYNDYEEVTDVETREE